MSIALWCILVAALLPVLAIFPAKLNKEYDNARPRDPEYWKSGFRFRAKSAHDNGLEAFPFFAISVLVGLWQGGSEIWIDKLAALFIAMRLIYIICYWTERPTQRSLAWLVGLASIIGIFTSPLWS